MKILTTVGETLATWVLVVVTLISEIGSIICTWIEHKGKKQNEENSTSEADKRSFIFEEAQFLQNQCNVLRQACSDKDEAILLLQEHIEEYSRKCDQLEDQLVALEEEINKKPRRNSKGG